MLTDKEREDIRRKMLELDDEPPANAWANIQAEIKPRRCWRLFWWLTPALLLVTATGAFFVWDKAIWNTVAPAITANVPSIQSAPEDAVQQTATSAADPQSPAVNQHSQESSLPTKPDDSPVVAPNPVTENKEPLARNPDDASPLAEQHTENAIPKATSKKQVSGKESNQPEEKFGQVSIAKDQPRLPPDREGQPAGKTMEPADNLQSDTYIPKKVTKPANEKSLQEESGTNKQVTPDKGLLRERNIDRSATRQPGTGKAIDIPVAGHTETKLNATNTASSGDSTSLTSEDKAITPKEVPAPPLLAEQPIEESMPDSVSKAFRPDTTSYTKEIIVKPYKRSTSKEWTVGLFFSPRYSFRIVTPSSSDEVYITGLNNRTKSGSERMGYELGLNVSKEVSRHLYLETSLAFVQLKENLSYSFTTGKVDTLIRQVSSDGQQINITAVYETGKRQLISSYAYGGWRIGATYYFWQNERRRFNIMVNSGVNLLVKGQTREIINGQESRTAYFPSKENILEQTNYNLLMGAGYSMNMLQKYELMLMPTLNYFLGSTFKNREPFGLRPYSLGLHVQLKRRLKGK